MSESDQQPEDVASLFKKFGGDAHGYREFADVDAPRPGAPAWALVPTPTSAGATPMPAGSTQTAPAGPAGPSGVGSIFSSIGPSEAALPTAPPARAELPSTAISRPSPVTAVSALWPARIDPQPSQPPRAGDPAPSISAGSRKLEVLFARWAGTTPAPAASAGGHGLLSRWRSQG